MMKNDNKFNYIFEERICPFCNLKLTPIVYGRYDSSKFDEDKYIWGGCFYSKSSPKYHCKKCDKDFDGKLKELQLEDYYRPKFNDKDYVYTKKHDELSLEELEKQIEIEKKKYEKFLANHTEEEIKEMIPD